MQYCTNSFDCRTLFCHLVEQPCQDTEMGNAALVSSAGEFGVMNTQESDLPPIRECDYGSE